MQVSPQVRHLSSRIFGGKGAKLTALFDSFLSVIAITATLHTGQIELLSKIKNDNYRKYFTVYPQI